LITKYRIEIWDSISKIYTIWWKGHDLKRAEIMFNKSYVQHLTRKLIKTTEEELYKEKGKI